jgi:outer membrane receptor protein involved in Fe transport
VAALTRASSYAWRPSVSAETIQSGNLKFNYGNFSASAKVNNLLDEEYNGSASVDFFGAVGFYPAPERNFILTAGYNF